MFSYGDDLPTSSHVLLRELSVNTASLGNSRAFRAILLASNGEATCIASIFLSGLDRLI